MCLYVRCTYAACGSGRVLVPSHISVHSNIDTYVSTHTYINFKRILPKAWRQSWRRVIDEINNWVYLVTVSNERRAGDECFINVIPRYPV